MKRILLIILLSLLSSGLIAQDKYLASEIGGGIAELPFTGPGLAYYGGLAVFNPSKRRLVRLSTSHIQEINLLGPSRNKQSDLSLHLGTILSSKQTKARLAIYGGIGFAFSERYDYESESLPQLIVSAPGIKAVFPLGAEFYLENPNADVGLLMRATIGSSSTYIGGGILLRFKNYAVFND